jgi:hypothetical protein
MMAEQTDKALEALHRLVEGAFDSNELRNESPSGTAKDRDIVRSALEQKSGEWSNEAKAHPWEEYKGDYYKCFYDIKVEHFGHEVILSEVWPNAGYFTTPFGKFNEKPANETSHSRVTHFRPSYFHPMDGSIQELHKIPDRLHPPSDGDTP